MPTPSLPNLLRDRFSSAQRKCLLRDLQSVRQDIYSTWISRHTTDRLFRAIEKSVDEMLLLFLAMELLPSTQSSFLELLQSHIWRSPADLGVLAGQAVPDRQTGHAVTRNACQSRLTVPASIRHALFEGKLSCVTEAAAGPLPLSILGEFHQMTLGNPLACPEQNQKRRMGGVHYTPSSLVDYLTCRTLPKEDLTSPLDILDPACGAGAFLMAAGRLLSQRAVDHRLFGGDIDPRAVSICRLGLAITGHAYPNTVDNRIRQRNQPIVLHEDFLKPETLNSRKFDVILGGPPFVRIEQIHRSSPDAVREYRKRFVCAEKGQFDLYMLFLEKSVKLLKPGGRLGFSVSNSFLRSQSGRSLRKLLTEQCHVEEVLEFDDGRLYPDASVRIASVILQRQHGRLRKLTKYAAVRKQGDVRKALNVAMGPSRRSILGDRTRMIRLPNRHGDAWTFLPERDRRFLKYMHATCPPDRRLPLEASLGLCTGADSIFILKRQGRKNAHTELLLGRHGQTVKLESAILRPILKTRQKVPSRDDSLPHVCVFPYDDEGKLLPENRLRESFPLAFAYLTKHRNTLARRSMGAKRPWFALRKADALHSTIAPKIVVPTFATRKGFVLDRQGILCHHSIITLTSLEHRISPYYVLGILNSSLLWRYLALISPRPTSRGCVLPVRSIRELPILVPGTGRERRLASELERVMRSGTHDNRGRVDVIVRKLYGLE